MDSPRRGFVNTHHNLNQTLSEVVTTDMKPVIETHNRCAFEMANA
jgi:hypothetical protein